jgi:hypothetical protein
VADALARNQELHGGDPQLALEVANMSPEQRARSQSNVRALVKLARRTLHKVSPDESKRDV